MKRSRMKNEALLMELENLSLELAKKEQELNMREQTLDDRQTLIQEQAELLEQREMRMQSLWHNVDGESINNTTDELTANLRDIMTTYSEYVFGIRSQMEVLTASCLNAVSRVLESGERDARNIFHDELVNALYASAVDHRSFPDLVDESLLKHALLNLSSPKEMERIGTYGLRGNLCLRRIILPEGIEEILPSFFFGCSNLVEVTIPASVKRIGTYAFYGCTGLKRIQFAPNSCLTEIGDYAFALNESLEAVVLPDTVETLGVAAFRSCASLQSVICSKNSALKTIGTHVFQNCGALEEVRFSDTVKTIPVSAFYACRQLRQVSAPGATRVDAYAFSEDAVLENVCLCAPKIIDDMAFANTSILEEESDIVHYLHDADWEEPVQQELPVVDHDEA